MVPQSKGLPLDTGVLLLEAIQFFNSTEIPHTGFWMRCEHSPLAIQHI